MAIFLRFFISYIKIQKISYKYYQYSIFYVTYSKYKTIAGVKSCKHWKKCSFFIQVSAKLGNLAAGETLTDENDTQLQKAIEVICEK